jgi:hypothetical protein
MAPIARRHHYIPAFLLAGFTQTGSKDDQLCVTDFKDGKEFRSTPLTTGFQRDFHTVESTELAPDYLENQVLAKIEGQVAPIINSLLKSHVMPMGNDGGELLHFLCLLMVRTPKARAINDNGADWLEKLALRTALQSEDRWTQIQTYMRDNGVPEQEVPSYDEITETLTNDRFTFKLDQNSQLSLMIQLADELVPSLTSRKWSVLVSPEGEFVCTDHPVTCAFTKPVPAIWTPAPGLPNTEVVCPISRHVCLLGSLSVPGKTVELPRNWVAYYNGRTLTGLARFAYSAVESFIWLRKDHSLGVGASELMRFNR